MRMGFVRFSVGVALLSVVFISCEGERGPAGPMGPPGPGRIATIDHPDPVPLEPNPFPVEAPNLHPGNGTLVSVYIWAVDGFVEAPAYAHGADPPYNIFYSVQNQRIDLYNFGGLGFQVILVYQE